MALALASNALTTVEAVEAEICTAAGANRDYYTRLINSFSSQIEKFLNRKIARQTVVEEKAPGFGTRFLHVKRKPLISITEILFNDDALDSSEYEMMGDGSAGFIFRLNGNWIWTAALSADISQSPVPGTEKESYKISYVGGYILPKDDAASPNERTLPFDIEQACIDMVANRFYKKGQDLTVAQDKVLSGQQNYNFSLTNQGTMSDSIKSVLKPYKRTAMA